MNKKLLSVILLLSVAILCLFALTACEMNVPGDPNTNTHVHEYSDEWTIDKEATCTSEGYKSHHCKNCDAKTDVTIIDKLEHNFEDGVCTICGVEDNDVTEESADLEYELSNDKYYYIVKGPKDKNSSTIVIPDVYNGLPVKEIGENAFYGCSNLESITIPYEIDAVGDGAFIGCNNLVYNEYGDAYYLGCDYNPYVVLVKAKNQSITSCTVNWDTKVIAYSAFSGCSSLQSITAPHDTTSIGSEAFSGCSSLESITIPDCVMSIGREAFYGCTSLQDITLPDNLTSIGRETFYGCSNLKTIIIPDSVTSIEERAFSSCSNLRSITIGNGLSWINELTFLDCYKLVEIINRSSLHITKDRYDYGNVATYALSIKTEGTSDIVTVNDYSFITDENNVHYLFDYVGNSTELVLPDNYSGQNYAINQYAFYNCSNLTSITVPNSVTSIGDSAFSGCSSLQSVTIGNSVTSIGSYAFNGCSNLTSVYITDITAWCNISFGSDAANPLNNAHNLYLNNALVTDLVIPDSVTSIGYSAFYGCSSLTSITIPDSVTSIGGGAFYNCSSLTSITIPDSVTSIGGSAFYNCSSLTSITIPDSLTSIGDGAFGGCSSLESITLPFVGAKAAVTSADTYQYPLGYIFGTSSYTGGTKTEQYYYGSRTTSTTSSTYYIPSTLKSVTITGGNILYGAFYNCNNLTSITIPDSVTSIGNGAFYNCSSLQSITIPVSVASIGDAAFYNCTSLTSITIPDSVTSIGSSAFNNCPIEETTVPAIACPYINNDKLKTVVITSGDSIAERAFYDCSSLRSITIGNGVTSIGGFAFHNCSGLQSITIPDSVTLIGDRAFYNCTDLKNITIGKSVTSIYYAAFSNCSSLQSITIPDSVQYIGSSVFYDCNNLTNITLGYGLTTIGSYAFNGCPIEEASIPAIACSYINNDKLKTVVITSGDSIAKQALYHCSSLQSLTIGNSVTSIGNSAFNGCTGLQNIAIPDSVTQIEARAFYNCIGLQNVTIGKSVTSFGYAAFSDCTEIQSIIIPDSVTSIDDIAFSGCNALTSITIPDSVTTIGYNAFHNCPIEEATIPTLAISYIKNDKLKNVVITSGDSIDNGAFSSCNNLQSITIPDSVTSIGNYAFYNCNSLTSITIPDSVTSIGNYAFYNCNSLTSITIPDGVTSIGDEAFWDCDFTSITIPSSVTSIGNSAFTRCYRLVEVIDNSSLNLTKGRSDNGYVAYYALNVKTEGTSDIVNVNDYLFYVYDNVNYLIGYVGNETELVLPDNYNDQNYQIYKYAFYYCNNLQSITIPDSITSLPYAAFGCCSSLKSITIPDSFTSLPDSVFSGCNNLESITIPNSIISIGDNAFNDCNNLKYNEYDNAYYLGNDNNPFVVLIDAKDNSITTCNINDKTKIIYNDAFRNCTGLQSVTIPDSVISIGYRAFAECPIKEATIPAIACSYIFNNKLETVIITSGDSIGDKAFYNCSSLQSVTISDSVTSIGDSAFYGCSGLQNITIPDSITSIGESAFLGCSSLQSITVSNANETYKSVDNCLIEISSKTLILGCKNSVLPQDGSVTSIANQAFSDCSITSITIPDSVTSIGAQAFRRCRKLTSMTIPKSVTSIGDNAFNGCVKLVEIINKSNLMIKKGSTACGYVARYALNVKTEGTSDIVNVNDYLFYTHDNVNYLLGYVGNDIALVLPDNYNGQNYELYQYAFYNCSNLKSVTISDSVAKIGNSAFSGCTCLQNINFKGTKEQWNAIIKGSYWKNSTENFIVYCTDGEISKSDA